MGQSFPCRLLCASSCSVRFVLTGSVPRIGDVARDIPVDIHAAASAGAICVDRLFV